MESKKILQAMDIGYASHRLIRDDQGIPIDYEILEVNSAFENMTGLTAAGVLNRRATEVLPGLRVAFDWVQCYAAVVASQSAEVFEQYSAPLGRWYRVQALPTGDDCFVTIFSDISPERAIASAAQRFHEYSPQTIDYQFIADTMRSISAAGYVLFNVPKQGGVFTTVAVSGPGRGGRQAAELLGFQVDGKTWTSNAQREKHIADNRITVIHDFRQLAGEEFPAEAATQLQEILNLDSMVVVQAVKNNVRAADFLLLYERGSSLERNGTVETFAEMVAMLLKRVEAEADAEAAHERLRSSEEKFRHIFERAPIGLFHFDSSGGITDCNDNFVDIIGSSREALIGLNTLDLPDKRLVQAVRSTINGDNGYYEGEYASITADKTTPIQAYFAPITNATGTVESGIGIIEDISVRTRAEQELVAARVQAETANRAKSEFVSNISHEIRTPLNGVVGFIDLLKNSPLNERQQEYVQYAGSSARSLLDVISDVLDFSKIEAGIIELHPVPCSASEIAEHALDIVAFHASRKGVELLLQVDANVPAVAIFDRVRLQQVLVNLLSNAVKFTDSGEVELGISFEPRNRFVFSVCDTGIGVTPEQRERIFYAFTQADGSITRRYGGSGLGLAIANQLVEKMGGRIELRSTPGQGSNFFFAIDSTVLTDSEAGQGQAGEIITQQRVVLLSDNPRQRKITVDLLEQSGVAVTACDSAEKLLQLNESDELQQVDALLIDFQLPEGDGLQLLQRLRKRDRTEPLPPVILMYISADMYELPSGTEENGVACLLKKPITIRSLQQCLAQAASAQPGQYSVQGNQNKETSAAEADQQRGSAPTIMIAEDAPANMLLIRRLLERQFPGVQIFAASNGSEALQLLAQHTVQLVLMDVQMPVMDGLQAARAIRARERAAGTPPLPIVALSAGVSPEEQSACIEAGMDDFLPKPLGTDRLAEMLKKYIEF